MHGGVANRDADRSANFDTAFAKLERLSDRVDQCLGERANLGFVAIADDGGELITAQPRKGDALAQNFGGSVTDLTQEVIADVMPERVVNFLEPVEVEEEQADERAATIAAGYFGQRGGER